jgi:acetyltransferase-like isoleucine patch superfamily enzyme
MHMLKRIIKFIVLLRFVNLMYNIISLKISKVAFRKSMKINGRLKMVNKGKVILGEKITINSGKNSNIIGGDIRTNIIVKANADFLIGSNVGISNSTFVCTKNITVEDDVLIGGSCKFYDTDFHSLDYVSRTNPYKNGIPDDNIKSAPILIKKGAWIGGSCLILKGVTIGTKSVIGAGSVVTKNIPNNEVWAGNPVKFIRKLSV